MNLYEEGNVCPHCGYIEGTGVEEAIHMQPGTNLRNRYTVGRVLGFGGFGVTYIGYDSILDQRVAIKEYLPSEFSTRVPGQSQVLVFDGDKSEQFRDGLKKFVEEARHLAKFQNEPGIVRIYDAFEENDTAYIVMEYLEGETLTSYLAKHGTIDEDTAVQMLTPIMESLKVVHAEGMLHRDIAPDNIFLTTDGEVRLIDFGASRYATTSHSRSLTVIIKPGFSPEEQYRSRGDQGPHTDVYALGATLYKMMTGVTPPDAMERRAQYENKNKDILVEPHKLNRNISDVREVALLNALNVRIEDRTPDVETFMQELNAEKPAKRIYGKIRRMNLYRLPLWVKIVLPLAVLAAGVFLALLATGVIDFSRFSQELVIPDGVVSVPEVEGMNKDAAIEAIEGNKLLASTAGNVESEYIKAGTIVLQNPIGGSYMNVSGTVMLTVSSGKAVEEAEDGISTVPYVIWDNLDDAIEKFKKAGLGEPEIVEEYDDSVAEGQIISQSIEAGEKVEEGTVLKLVVSLGPKSFEMPDLVGMTKEEAEELLASKGISVTVSYVQDDSYPEGQILSQSIDPKTEVKRGDSVTLTAAAKEDTIAVSDVTGKTRKEAEKELKDQGFKVTVLENYSDDVPKGEVISQNPEEGTKLKEGDNVTLYVSKGPEEETKKADAENKASASETKKPSETQPTETKPTETQPTQTQTQPTQPTQTKPTETKPPETKPAAPKTYKVSFDGQGGSVSAGSITVTEGKTYGNLPTASRAGYNFLGWFTAPSGGTQVTSGTKVTLTGNQTLYAQWSGVTVKITFDPAGGSVSPGSVTGTYGSSVSLPVPTKTGYAFQYWYYFKDNMDHRCTTSETITFTSDIIFYAEWAPVTVTLTFDGQGGTVSETTRQVTYGQPVGILPTATREGYTFNRWCYYMDGYDPTLMDNDPSRFAVDTVIYAVWVPNEYTISWNEVNGATISVTRASDSPYSYMGTNVYNGDTVKYGDKLNVSYSAWEGYNISNTGPATITVSGNVTSEHIHVTATPKNVTYNIVYVSSNGTSLGSSTETHAYGSTVTVYAPSKSGYQTPGSQSVYWDSLSAKTITFTYTPTGVGTQTLQSAKWWNYSSSKYFTSTVTVSYSNRTASSVVVNITWTQSRNTTSLYYGYAQYCTVAVGGVSSSKMSVDSSVFASGSSTTSVNRTAKITVTGLSATQTSASFSVSWSDGGGGHDISNASGSVTIPAY